jgi:iron complex transport system substrate-binding protein
MEVRANMRSILGACAIIAVSAWAVSAQAACDLPVKDGPVVSVGSDVTEIVYALGAGDRVIAVDITSREPKAARDLPQVGYMRQLSAEPILSLSPRLILAIADSGPPLVLDQLKAAGACLVLVPDEHSTAGVIKKVETVASALGRETEGEALTTKLAADFTTLQSTVAGFKEQPSVLFLFSVGQGAPTVGRNAIEDFTNFKPVSSEGIIAAKPDVLLVTELTLEKMGGVEGLLQRTDVAQTPAGKNKRVVAMESLLLLGFGPRTPQAIRDLATALHPGAAIPDLTTASQ